MWWTAFLFVVQCTHGLRAAVSFLLQQAQKPTRGLDLRALSAHALGGERERPSNMFADDVADDLLVVQQMSKK